MWPPTFCTRAALFLACGKPKRGESGGQLFVDLATVIWLVLFTLLLVPDGRFRTPLVEASNIDLLGVFIADLGVAYHRTRLPLLAFLRTHWVDVLLVIPYFRIFRVFRAARVIRLARMSRLVRATRVGRVAKAGNTSRITRIVKSSLGRIKAVKKTRRAVGSLLHRE